MGWLGGCGLAATERASARAVFLSIHFARLFGCVCLYNIASAPGASPASLLNRLLCWVQACVWLMYVA